MTLEKPCRTCHPHQWCLWPAAIAIHEHNRLTAVSWIWISNIRVCQDESEWNSMTLSDAYAVLLLSSILNPTDACILKHTPATQVTTFEITGRSSNSLCFVSIKLHGVWGSLNYRYTLKNRADSTMISNEVRTRYAVFICWVTDPDETMSLPCLPASSIWSRNSIFLTSLPIRGSSTSVLGAFFFRNAKPI